jgi:hypothetical protein
LKRRTDQKNSPKESLIAEYFTCRIVKTEISNSKANSHRPSCQKGKGGILKERGENEDEYSRYTGT